MTSALDYQNHKADWRNCAGSSAVAHRRDFGLALRAEVSPVSASARKPKLGKIILKDVLAIRCGVPVRFFGSNSQRINWSTLLPNPICILSQRKTGGTPRGYEKLCNNKGVKNNASRSTVTRQKT